MKIAMLGLVVALACTPAASSHAQPVKPATVEPQLAARIARLAAVKAACPSLGPSQVAWAVDAGMEIAQVKADCGRGLQTAPVQQVEGSAVGLAVVVAACPHLTRQVIERRVELGVPLERTKAGCDLYWRREWERKHPGEAAPADFARIVEPAPAAQAAPVPPPPVQAAPSPKTLAEATLYLKRGMTPAQVQTFLWPPDSVDAKTCGPAAETWQCTIWNYGKLRDGHQALFLFFNDGDGRLNHWLFQQL